MNEQPLAEEQFETPTAESEFKPKKTNEIFKILGLVVGVLVVIGLFVNAYFLMKGKEENPLPAEPTKAVLSPTPTIDPTADWKTYRNEEYGFEVKYPVTLVPKEETSDIFLVRTYFDCPSGCYPKNFNIEVRSAKTVEKEVEYEKWRIVGHVTDKIEKEESISVLGYKGKKLDFFVEDDSIGKKSFATIIVIKDKHTYVISGESLLTRQILSTFRFIEGEESDETIRWKTFVSSDNAYSFKYPEDWEINDKTDASGFVTLQCNKCPDSSVDLFQIITYVYKSVDEYIKEYPDRDYRRIKFKGLDAVEAVIPGGPQAGGSALEIFVINNGQGYSLQYRFGGLYDITKLNDLPKPKPDILSTFEFLD